MEVEGQSEGKRLVEVKIAGIQRKGSGPRTCPLEVQRADDSFELIAEVVADQRPEYGEARS
jgi:hypothetical protein